MRTGVRQSGFSLVEMIVVLAVILILAGALLGVGRYLTVRANADLTASGLEVIATALQQYYDDFEKFPFATDVDNDGDSFTDVDGDSVFGDTDLPDYNLAALEDPVIGLNGTVSGGTLLDTDASSSALFYCLDKAPNSRKIIDALSATLVTNKGAGGFAVQLDQPAGSGNLIDLPRFIDAWGTSIRYEYLPDTAFPILTSAGPDMIFGTPDDIKCQ